MEAFRNRRLRRPLERAEKRLVAILGVYLCFLPWALGAELPWLQWVSLAIAALGFAAALGSPGSGRRLVRFPIFWIGLALLGYIAVQGANPSWRYVQTTTLWWLVRVRNIPWLPTSIEAPFAKFNAWRQEIVYAAAWLSVCSVWVGVTRRRSLRILLGVVVGNGLALVGLLAVQRFTGNQRIPWPLTAWTRSNITASFIYENHTGAYLGLVAFCAIALALWVFDRDRRALAKSTSAGVLAFGALALIGAVFFTLSRGAVLTLTISVMLLCAWLMLRQRFLPKLPGANPVLKQTVIALFVVFILVVLRYLDFSEIYRRWDAFAEQGRSESSIYSRRLARAAAIGMIEDLGLRGVGAGCFRHRFPLYVMRFPPIYQGGNLYWEHAHCDWLEIPIELGLAGDLLVLLGAAWGMAWFARRRILWHPLAVPLLLGCLQTVLHAGFDFPFQCPAILTTWCVLLALAGRWIELEK